MRESETTDLVDIGIAGDPIYADGIAELQNLGVNFQTTYFCWMKIGGLWRKVSRLHIIRPRSSLPANGPHDLALSKMDWPGSAQSGMH